MPWTAEQAQGHNKAADTADKQHQWSTVANAVLAKSGDDGKAIRIANAAVDRHPSTARTLAKSKLHTVMGPPRGKR